MATFAKINDEGFVLKVESVNNKVIQDSGGQELEILGIQFLRELYKEQGSNWKQGSYNTYHNKHKLGGTPFRYNAPSMGFTYNSVLDAFIPPKPYESWVLDESICDWKAPVELPGELRDYKWDEATISWVYLG